MPARIENDPTLCISDSSVAARHIHTVMAHIDKDLVLCRSSNNATRTGKNPTPFDRISCIKNDSALYNSSSSMATRTRNELEQFYLCITEAHIDGILCCTVTEAG